MSTKKLKTKLSLVMIALVILVVVFVGIAVSLIFVDQNKTRISELVTTNGSSNVLSINEYISFLEKDIVSIAVSGSLTSNDLSFDQRQMNIKAIKDSREDISSLYTINNKFIAVNDADPGDIGEDYSSEYWAQNAMNQDGFYLDIPSYDEWTENITMTVMYRVKEHGFNGIICMDIHYNVINDIVNQDQFGSDGYTMILDSEGLIITHPDEDLVKNRINILDKNKNNPEFKNALEKALSSESGLIKNVAYNGEDLIFYYNGIQGADWKLISVIKMSHYMDALYSQILYIAAIGLVSILIATFIAFMVSRMIAGPISKMAVRMRQFAEGDLHSPMPDIKSNSEIGILYESLKESTNSLSRYVNDISGILESMAKGDISCQVSLDYMGDFAPIKKSLNEILGSLNNVIGTIKQASKEVDSMSEQMAASAQQLSSNTIEKAATTDELETTFKNIKESLENTAANTAEALHSTSKMKSQISLSTEEMKDMLDSMNEISKSASSIGNIIRSIDDIAFQTNILSLNAAVEAARAGQHGKGFGVVADEVRNLAGKSAESAKQSDELVISSIAAVEKGENTAQRSYSQIKEVEMLVEGVTKLVTEIETMAAKQAAGAGDIYNGIAQLNNIIQNDSAMSEQNASQSQELSMMASELQKKLSFFTLRDGEENNTRLFSEGND